jgi:hypothetical protein
LEAFNAKEIINRHVRIYLLACSYSYAPGADNAQMGVSQQELMREHLEHGSVMHRLMLMTNIMSQVMGKMALILQENQIEKMKRISGLMTDMSEQAKEMSRIMEAGNASAEEMMHLQNKTMQLQQKMSEIETGR